MLGNKQKSGAIIFHIMKEEYDRLREAEHMYQESIQKLPQGAPQQKHVRNGKYLYLARRKGPRVIFRYIGLIMIYT